MLKTFIVQQSVASIEVEECYHSWIKELRTDKYVTVGLLRFLIAIELLGFNKYYSVLGQLQVTLFQLEKIYGTSPDAQQFIKALISGLAVRDH